VAETQQTVVGNPEREVNPEFLAQILESLPGAVFVIDGVGNVLWGTAQAAALVGDAPDSFAGRSVLEFVTPDTAWAYASAVALASDYPEVTMGPLRIAYIDGEGQRRDADMWATNRLDDPLIGGIVCLITKETAASGMADAVSAVAAGQLPAQVGRLVTAALRGAPTVCDASLLAIVDGDLVTIARSAGSPDVVGRMADDPWRPVMLDGIRQLYGELADAPAPIRDIAVGAAADAVWVEPVIDGRGGTAHAALVMWRSRAGNPSPNQLTVIHEAAAILALAFRNT